MYWRVRKLSLSEIVEKFWIHAALIVSVCLNIMLIASRPNLKTMVPKDLQANYEQFARTVTAHLLDSSYISYKDSTNALLTGELAPPVIKWMRDHELLARNQGEADATAKTLYDQRQVSAIRIDNVIQLEPDRAGAPIPVEVRGCVVIHSAQDNGPTDPVPFHLRYFMALRPNPEEQGKPLLDQYGKPVPYVVNFQELSAHAN